MIIASVKYAIGFIKNHFWAILKMLLVFMAFAIALGLIIKGSSLLLLQGLSNQLWLTVVLESPLLAVAGFVVFGIWNVSFITYILALERIGSASVRDHLKKSWSLRVLKIMFFDLIIVLFLGVMALILSGAALGAWWFSGMQLVLWHRIGLGVSGVLLMAGMFYLLMRLFFTKIVIADTDTDLFTAFSTSWLATDGLFWRLFALLFVVGIIGGLVTGVASQISLLMGYVLGDSIGALLGKVLEVFAAVINLVFAPIVVLYYYLQLKVARSLVSGR